MSQRKFAKNLSNVCSVRTNPHSLTPTNPKKHKSPYSHSKCSCNSNLNHVSYGELQIVLENLQTIKQKASAQLQQLTTENDTLRQEITELKQYINELKV